MGKAKLGKFEILEKELKYSTRIVDLYIEKIKTPENNIVEWVHINHDGAAAILPIDNDGKIILIRQYRNNVDDIVYEIPAGGLNKDESPYDCAKRELEEETGYKAKNIVKLFSAYSSIGITNELITYYLASDLYLGKTNFDEDEYIEVIKFTTDEIIEMINKGIITDSKVIISVMYYLNMIKKPS